MPGSLVPTAVLQVRDLIAHIAKHVLQDDSAADSLVLVLGRFALPHDSPLPGTIRENDELSVLRAGCLTSRDAPRTASRSRSPRRVTCAPGPLLQPERVPLIDPWGRDKGKLLEALAVCGAVYLEFEDDSGAPRLPRPEYERWRQLLSHTRDERHVFRRRQCVQGGFLRLSYREDLKRTLDGDGKEHAPDDREMFGFADHGVRARHLEWNDLAWIPTGYTALKEGVVALLEEELKPTCSAEKRNQGTLTTKICRGKEKWGSTRLRHCFYPAAGSCTEHTDYGVVTFQHCSIDGLQGFIGGQWCPLQPPEKYALLFAGDMLERLTNGRIKALLHRVALDGDTSAAPRHRPVARQSHVLFLQPDAQTVVQPLSSTLSGNATDLGPVRYGDWHREKVALAFGLEEPWAAPARIAAEAVAASLAAPGAVADGGAAETSAPQGEVAELPGVQAAFAVASSGLSVPADEASDLRVA